MRDGLALLDDTRLTVTELGRPFLRHVCAAFDAYLEPAAARHSTVV